MTELAFDQVAVKKAAGVNLVSAEEWLKIPKLEQFDLITKSQVEFLRGGERVSSIDAVRSINAVTAHQKRSQKVA